MKWTWLPIILSVNRSSAVKIAFRFFCDPAEQIRRFFYYSDRTVNIVRRNTVDMYTCRFDWCEVSGNILVISEFRLPKLFI